MNPLLEPFETVHQSVPFQEIREEHYLPAFQELVRISEEEIKVIAENPAEATFENTIEALAYSGEQLNIVSNIFFNLNSAETNDEIQKIAQEVSPLLAKFSSKIFQNEMLFNRIKKVFDERESLSLNEEQQTLLNETYKGFVRSGALLSHEDKKELERIDVELSIKSLQFGQNVLASTNAYFKHITNKEELRGIPESVLAQYAEDAREKGLGGYVITLQYPSYLPLMTYAENRGLRKELALANGKKAFDNGEFDNQQLIKELVKLRQEKVKLLGYQNFADFVLEERMAKSPINVFNFLSELLEKAMPFAEKEINELKILARADGIEDLQTYDHAFYVEKLRKAKFDLNDEELRPYFPLDKVQEAVFGLAEKLFNLKFRSISTQNIFLSPKREDNIQKYHEEVNVFEVLEKSSAVNSQQLTTYKALLYTDYHPRRGKRAGAWMTSFRNQYKKDGENCRPHVSVVCNFTRPTTDTPSLLTFQEVTTLFHEFGHAIHGILADTQYPNLSGTSVKWDFVELPSQFLENYCYEPEFLKSFAQHYQTGETLSDEKIEKLAQSKNFMEGYQTLRQLGFGLLDMAYHSGLFPTLSGESEWDIKVFEDQIIAKTNLYPKNPETAISTSFSHIFQGGYSAGYYSYKWAEVLDADAFQYFKENGIFNPEIAAKYRVLLSSGGTREPMELYKNFRGSEPKVESLLKRAFG